MKFLMVTHCFYPSKKRGGPTVSMVNMAKSLAHYADVSVLTTAYEADGTRYEGIKEGKNDFAGVSVYYLEENTPKSFYKKIKELSPDVIYISSLFSWQYVIPTLYYTSKYHIRSILAPRGELMPNALAVKSARKKVYIIVCNLLRFFKNVEWHATSDEEQLEISAKYANAKIWNIKNLPTISEPLSVHIEKEPDLLKIIFVGRIHPIKNLDVAISALKDIKSRVIFDVYGVEENAEYYRKCVAEVATLPSNITVTFHGVIDHEDIPAAISSHHILLSPTQTENFGQAIVEALLQHRPVVISQNTPWRELSKFRAGVEVSLENMQGFTDAIETFASMGQNDFDVFCDGAASYIKNKLEVEKTEKEYIALCRGEK